VLADGDPGLDGPSARQLLASIPAGWVDGFGFDSLERAAMTVRVHYLPARLLASLALAAVGLIVPLAVPTVQPASAQPASTDWAGSSFCASQYDSPYLGNSYGGVAACGTAYGDDGNTNEEGPISYNGVQFDSIGFQCVELVMRYMYYDFGVAPYSANGNTVVSNYSGNVFTKETDPATDGLPSVGDVLSFAGTSSNPDGHTSIVTNVSSSSLTTLNENDTSNGLDTVPVSGGVVSGGVTGWLHIPNNTPPPNGTFVSYNNDDYIMAGGALLYISTWAVYGGTPPSSDIMPLSQTQWTPLENAVPSNGTFINAVSGSGQEEGSYVIAGGAPMYISSWGVYGGTQPMVTVDSWDLSNIGNSLDHLSALPADGTFVNARNGDGSEYGSFVFAGGAPLFISSWGVYGGTQPNVTIDSWAVTNAGNPMDHINQYPANGTFVNARNGDGSEYGSFVFAGGAPLYVSSWAFYGGTPSSLVTVDSWAVTNAGNSMDHINQYPANGTAVWDGNPSFNQYQGYVFAGGAPLAVAAWSDVGNPAATEVDGYTLNNFSTSGTLSHVLQYPANGTAVYEAESGPTQGAGYIFAGGATLYVSNWSNVGTPSATGVDGYALNNFSTSGPLSHVLKYPANGTFLSSSSGDQYVTAGSAALPVTDCSVLNNCPGSVLVDAWDFSNIGNPLDHLLSSPSDGTVVQGLPSGDYWEFIGGTAQPIASSGSSVAVDDSSVSSFPIGPTLTAVSPSSRGQGSTTTMTLTGTGFEQGATVTLSGKGVLLSSVVVNSYTSITATVTVKASAKAGTHTITVTNPDGASIACTNCLTIDAGPTISTASPSSIAPGAKKVPVTLTGKGFQTGATVSVSGTGIKIVSVTVISSTDIRLIITVPSGTTAGSRTITITNPDGGTTQAQVLRIT